MENERLPEITADEVERRAASYVETAMEDFGPQMLAQPGMSNEELRFAFRQNFYSFIASHFVVVPSKAHSPRP